MRCIMCKDKRMFALIIAIFISVLLITGWVFADHTVIDLIGATPILELQKTDPAPADVSLSAAPAENGICVIPDACS